MPLVPSTRLRDPIGILLGYLKLVSNIYNDSRVLAAGSEIHEY